MKRFLVLFLVLAVSAVSALACEERVTLCHNGHTITAPPTEPPVVPTEPPVEPPVVPTVDDPEQFLFNLQWDGDPSIPFAQLCYLDGSGCLGPVMMSELATINGSVFAQVDFILVDWYDPHLLAAFYDGQPLDGWYRAGYGLWEYRDF